MDIGFELNYQHVLLVDTDPRGEGDWAYAGPGIESIADNIADVVSTKSYYDMGGSESDNVTGVNSGVTITGDRLRGDKFQDWAVSLAHTKGDERKTRVRQVSPAGEIIEWPTATMKNIKGSSADGNANDNTPFSCEIKFEGDPVLIEPEKGVQLPETVTVADVEVAVGAKVKLSPSVTPEQASAWCLYAVAQNGRGIASVDAEGNVTGISAGETTVTVKCAAKPSVNAQAKVTVTAA